jgi:hypothetical protein
MRRLGIEMAFAFDREAQAVEADRLNPVARGLPAKRPAIHERATQYAERRIARLDVRSIGQLLCAICTSSA